MCCCAEIQQYVSTTINLYVSKSARQCVSMSVQQQYYAIIVLNIKVLPFFDIFFLFYIYSNNL